ncbi:MAG: tRNA (adenosine(37)-N6)-threonylcarbamoyltransferase complex dimerization subunit type 1 TsaB [Ignavibacteria bacterium]|jgi:tRNA threonylcarbamoyladenosine biosynthesis protein TsaB|nr:tRNA (adenosine(37)-N6)-threonylcarbamoyltransferase complex dimerization subunit type 1 TsaB [Ignavibacteria bacterium]MDH7528829.1 tRNA (adenosine(37)-N6)-threonylcarbamoyltransferase complex dimerization subunit type 1 TsaB [Ignavibacteria bacterium]NPV10582.1 tRNA (adenosine(37)-N6)-threonylcarbamoyltransferase complex dimerization subunit type 1 TsaB [Ignavibacteria bacterium]
MKLLSISTASDVLSLSLVEDDRMISYFESEGNKRHAELISPEIKHLMESSRLKFSDLDGVCVNLGPGSFTGLRVGLSIAKGIVFGANLKLYGYTNFEEFLKQAVSKEKIDGKCAILIPSRKNEFYFGAFAVQKEGFTQLDSFELMSFDELKNYVHHFEYLIFDEKIKNIFQEFSETVRLISLKNNAYYGALLVKSNPEKYYCENYSYLEPLYLKNFDAKLKK